MTRRPLNREESQHSKTIKALEASSRSCICCYTKSWVTSTRANEFAGSVVLCLMTSLTPMLHIVSQASGNRSAADVPTLPPGAHRLARRTDGFWQGRAQQPAATVAQFAGHINLFPAIVRDDLSGADPEARPPRPSHLHIFVTPGAGSSKKKKKRKKVEKGR